MVNVQKQHTVQHVLLFWDCILFLGCESSFIIVQINVLFHDLIDPNYTYHYTLQSKIIGRTKWHNDVDKTFYHTHFM